MSNSNLFVVTLNTHPVLGNVLIPFLSNEVSSGVIQLDENATVKSKQEMALDSTQKKIVKLAQQITDKELMKIFSKERVVADFFRRLSPKILNDNVLPYIEKKHYEIILQMRKGKIPLYLRDRGVDVLYEHHRINICETNLTVKLKCEITDSYFRYALLFFLNGGQVRIHKAKPFLQLGSEPALLVVGKDLWVFDRIRAGRVSPFLEKDYVEAPPGETKRYLENIILPMMREYPVEVSGIELAEKEAPRKAQIRLNTSLAIDPHIELSFQYGEISFPPTRKILSVYPELEEKDGRFIISYLKRDLEWEQRCVDRLLNEGFIQVSDSLFRNGKLLSEFSLVDWMSEQKEQPDSLFSFETPEKEGAYFIGKIEVKQDIEDMPDWFEVRMSVRIGDYSFPFIRFKKNIINGDRRFRLPDGEIALLPEEWFEKYGDLMSFGEDTGKKIIVKKIHASILDKLLPGHPFREKTDYQSKEIIQVPPRINAVLRPYQHAGFSWLVHLAKNKFGGCLADDMGLGKTLQTITLLQHIYDPEPPEGQKLLTARKVDRSGQLSIWDDMATEQEDMFEYTVPTVSKGLPASLIVVPTSLIENWKREIRKFSSLKVYEYSGERRIKSVRQVFNGYQIVLMTYGILRRDIDVLEKYAYKYIILDESQNIKNPESQIYHAVVRLRGDNRLVLTGTPIENSLKDLWAQFNFINPGLLGTASFFRNRFVVPITKEGNVALQQKLQRLISPFLLRRTKKQVAPELPSLTEEVIYCDMTPEQKEVYVKEKNLLRNSLLDEWNRNKLLAINGILKLRQLANHPKILLEDYNGSSGKMEQILDAYETLLSEGHKVLIFSSFVSHLDLLGKEFKRRGWRYALLTGATQKRDQEILKFTQNKEISAFLISLKAGGVGLNLTEADYVFIIDPWWNPAAEMQAESRAHRIGQDKQVFVYRFITGNTIEEKIRLLQERKNSLADTFISENDPLQSLTDQEWRELFYE